MNKASERNPSKSPYNLRGRLPLGVITAAAAALAVGNATQPSVAGANAPRATISAESHHAESHKQAVAKLDHTYRELSQRAESMAHGKNSRKENVAIKSNPTIMPDGSVDSVLQMQSDVYNQQTHEAQVCVVSVYKPDEQNQHAAVKPYSIFEVAVYTGLAPTMPTSPEGFDEAAKKIHFSLSLTKGQNEEWNVASQNVESGRSFAYNTALSAGELSVERNKFAVDGAISEAAYLLNHLAQAGGQLN